MYCSSIHRVPEFREIRPEIQNACVSPRDFDVATVPTVDGFVLRDGFTSILKTLYLNFELKFVEPKPRNAVRNAGQSSIVFSDGSQARRRLLKRWQWAELARVEGT